MSQTIAVQYHTRPDSADENQRLIEQVFAELRATAPDGLRYAVFRLADGVSFLHIAVTDTENNPLLGTPAFNQFTKAIGDRLAGQPIQQDATLIDSYRFMAT
ncbi:hypothetical protein ETD83_13295 [Actinomadura soli]|uniref:Antibiotic biosynthesis monooxygenase n=1 Tax=Actinomadura soli TaxID=2508997 RepID=A0A5C4JET3_9ACTN|nr:hypothetical protein [Actinomadura soli]TMR02185.1 hypothetical protein ETD83_13295 [Actinomadura soli]